MVVRTSEGCIQWLLYGQKVQGECSCNENGCTDDSPACCANGTCGKSQKATLARVHLITFSEVDPAYSNQLNLERAGANSSSLAVTPVGPSTVAARS
ncbi:hypothetical protein BP00DRAFT_254888 [Aspergillus indologenus CBS 114.80]|uniref:Uncharacterized protein n=1 Tax=Aspergillus indologenus CBS 114.80 TaxID=1450541 RepID=A0A2V5HW16_9EURO|nr:hypothetical protein BP00DRAFT_254888 [Aspergillus indologenus CBS 114.80]